MPLPAAPPPSASLRTKAISWFYLVPSASRDYASWGLLSGLPSASFQSPL